MSQLQLQLHKIVQLITFSSLIKKTLESNKKSTRTLDEMKKH